jgi:glycosyltransferase involved in cell wall biosynthesis
MMKAEAFQTGDPLVSILILAYNHGPFIAECLDSLLCQETDFPYEICIGEDESSDETRAICQRYAAEHPDKIRLFLRSRNDVVYINGKPTGNFNFIETVKACRGRYVAFCEGDDFWIDSAKLALQVRALEDRPDCSICFCNVRIVFDDGTASYEGYGVPDRSAPFAVMEKPSAESDIKRLAKGNFIHTPGVMFRNWLLMDSLPEFMRSVDFGDWPFHMCSARYGKILYLDQVLAAYRVHGAGVWSCRSNINRIASTIRTGCILMSSGLFSEEVNEELWAGISSKMERVWMLILANNVDDLPDGWFGALTADNPAALAVAEGFARKYQHLGYYRFLRKLKKTIGI